MPKSVKTQGKSARLASSGPPGGPLGGILGRLGPGPSDTVGSRLGGLSGPTGVTLGVFQGRLRGHLGRLGGLLG
eukprot:2798640-Pyramimonas_sp.AAC.1